MLKDAWVTRAMETENLCSITLESDSPKNQFTKISIRENSFPLVPTKDHPLRHTIVLGLFDQKDINLLAKTFDEIRTDR